MGKAELTPPAGTLRMLALGDSYTIGEGVGESERWPMQLAAQLRSHGAALGQPEIIARTGWTTDDLDQALTQRDPRGPYDIVTLLIGVNDQYGGRPLESYHPRFVALLQRAIALAGGRADRVIVVSIPDWSVTPFAARFDRAQVAAELREYNALNRDEAARAAVRYVDITPQSREAANDAGLLAADGLHPSGKMYAGWVELLLPEALAALTTR